MRIVVCVKQVPAGTAVKIDPETKRLVREGVEAVMNPFDLPALETALRLRDTIGAAGAVGGEVIALTMGPPKAEGVLREALALGADRAVLLSDRRFGGSDTWATSYVLSRALQTLGDVDLVLCGKQAIDGDTAQVGPGIAAHCAWAQATEVDAIETPVIPDGTITARRRSGPGHTDRFRLRLPAVLAVTQDIHESRVPRLAGWLRAVDAPVTAWDADAIAADATLIGLKGSPTRVVSTAAPAPRGKDARWLRGPEAESALMIFGELRDAFSGHAKSREAVDADCR